MCVIVAGAGGAIFVTATADRVFAEVAVLIKNCSGAFNVAHCKKMLLTLILAAAMHISCTDVVRSGCSAIIEHGRFFFLP